MCHILHVQKLNYGDKALQVCRILKKRYMKS